MDLHDLLLEQGNVCSVAFGIGATVNNFEKDIFRFSSKQIITGIVVCQALHTEQAFIQKQKRES